MSRRLETRLRAAEEQMERRHPRPHPPNPVEDFGRWYPKSMYLLSDLCWYWCLEPDRTTPPAPTIMHAALTDPRAAVAMKALADLIRCVDSTRDPAETAELTRGMAPAEAAASERRARGMANQFLQEAAWVAARGR